jgi:hypothetical protein
MRHNPDAGGGHKAPHALCCVNAGGNEVASLDQQAGVTVAPTLDAFAAGGWVTLQAQAALFYALLTAEAVSVIG